MSWIPLINKTHYSLQMALSKPEQLVQRCVELEYSACAITDINSVSGAVDFIQECQEAKIKPILGCELTISDHESNIVLLAKNKKGWQTLIELVSLAHDNKTPQVSLEQLIQSDTDDLIAIIGHLGSYVRNAQDYTISEMVYSYNNIFKHLYIGIYTLDGHLNGLDEMFRGIAEDFDLPTIAVNNSYYPKKENVDDHRLILCSKLQSTLSNVNSIFERGKNVDLMRFFKSEAYSIPTEEELLYHGNTAEEIHNTAEISDMCEEYDLFSAPLLPEYKWTSGLSSTDYLHKLTYEGYEKKCHAIDDEVYRARIEKELAVFKEFNLEGYFLIVQDYVGWAKKRMLVGPARGSACGSLVSYLIDITNIDPIPFDLLFERFFNSARVGSLPDIDIDFPPEHRESVIDYVKDKYGHENVCQMVTFGRMMGRGVLKEVLRVHEAAPSYLANEITKNIPQEAEISEHLEAEGEHSILRWTLKNEPKILADWCTMDENGILSGEYSTYFEQAIRIEGTFRTQGKHAAGLIISSHPLNSLCPMIRDKHGEKIAGMDMDSLSKIGLPKFDMLGVNLLSKLMGVNSLKERGKIGL